MADDTPEVLHEAFGATDDRAETAARNRAEFEGFVRGADARAALLPRANLGQLAFAASRLMVMQILTGRLKPKTAKEASDIAKAMNELGRRESGEADSTIVIQSAEQRQTAIDRIKELNMLALERGAEATVAQPVLDVSGTEVNPDVVAAGLVTHAPRPSRALRRVPGHEPAMGS